MGLLEKLKAGKKNIKVLKFPGTDADICLRILSNQEIQDSVFATEHHFEASGVKVNSTILDAYEDERTTQLLFRALRDPVDPKKTFASTVNQLRDLLTKEEKDILADFYLQFENECSPNLKEISNEEFETLWEGLKKNPENLSSGLPSIMLKKLLLYLASRPANSQTASGSMS